MGTPRGAQDQADLSTLGSSSPGYGVWAPRYWITEDPGGSRTPGTALPGRLCSGTGMLAALGGSGTGLHGVSGCKTEVRLPKSTKPMDRPGAEQREGEPQAIPGCLEANSQEPGDLELGARTPASRPGSSSADGRLLSRFLALGLSPLGNTRPFRSTKSPLCL